MTVSAHRCHISLTSFSVSLLCNLVLNALSLQKQIRIFHMRQKVSWFFDLEWFFFNHITNFRAGCPMWLFKVLLPSLVFVIWVGILGYCLRQLLRKLASHAKQSKPRIFRKSFSPLFIFCSFKNWHSNTIVPSVGETPFSLIFLRPSLLQKIQWGFKIIFSKTMEEYPEALGC